MGLLDVAARIDLAHMVWRLDAVEELVARLLVVEKRTEQSRGAHMGVWLLGPPHRHAQMRCLHYDTHPERLDEVIDQLGASTPTGRWLFGLIGKRS